MSSDVITGLTSVAIDAMSVREALEKAFNDDWNNRRRVQEAHTDEIVSVSVTFTVRLPAALAKEALREL